MEISRTQILGWNYIVSQPEGEGGDIFGTMLAIDKDVMLAVTNGARLSIGDHNHRSMFSRHSAIRLD